MSLVKVLFFMFLIYYNLQTKVCYANGLAKQSETEADSRVQRSTSSYRNKQLLPLYCPNDDEICRFANMYRRMVESKRRCCRARHKACKRKFFKTCRKPKCYKKQSIKCLKRFKKCYKSRINPLTIGRRPKLRQCGLPRFSKRKPSNAPTTSKQKETEEHSYFPKKRLKERCGHNDDCDEGLCCAQHHHVKICKPLIQEGQVCTRQFFTRKRSPDVFERCPCAGSLVCSRTESQHNTCQVPT